MSFDRAIETIEAIISRQRESVERFDDAKQQAYLESIQTAVSKIVVCISEAHQLSKLSNLRGINHLRKNSNHLKECGKVFGPSENLVIENSKTAEIGAALVVFFTQFLETHRTWTMTVRTETQEKIQNLKTNLELFNQEMYRQQLTKVIDASPGAPVDLVHVKRDDARGPWYVVPTVETLTSDDINLYQPAMQAIRNEANKLQETLQELQILKQRLLAIPFPVGTGCKPEHFEVILEEKISHVKEKIDTQTVQIELLENAFRLIQGAYLQRANEEGQISPTEREQQRLDLDAKITKAEDKFKTSRLSLSTKAVQLGITTLNQLEDLAKEINISKQQREEIAKNMTTASKLHAAKVARLNLFIERLKGGEHEDPGLSMRIDELIDELNYDVAKELVEIWTVRLNYNWVEGEIGHKSWFGSLKTKAREEFFTIIDNRIKGLNRQHETKMLASTQESEGIQSRTTALIELAHQELKAQLHRLKYNHHQINKKHTEINFVLADVRAEIESLKDFKTQSSGTNAHERVVEYQDVYNKLQKWLEEHQPKITALQWQIAEKNRQQGKANSAVTMDALAPLPTALTVKIQKMATLTQAQNDTMASLGETCTEINSLCQWFTKLRLEKILEALKAVDAQEAEEPKEKHRLLVSIKKALGDLAPHRTWLTEIPGHHSENYELSKDIFRVQTKLCAKQSELLHDEHSSLATVGARFFNTIFPDYLQQRAVKYFWLDAFSKLLGFMFGVFGYKTAAQARTDYIAELKNKWTFFEHEENHPTTELTSFIDQGLKFSPRKLDDQNSLRTKLGLFQQAVKDVSTTLSSESPSQSLEIR